MDWGEMLRAGLRIGVRPEGFWRMSLREWQMVMAGPVLATPLGRRELDQMLARWPDEGAQDARI